MSINRNLSFLAEGASSSGVLSVTKGGTGLTTLTAGYIPYGNGTSALSSSSNLQFDGSNLGLGVTPSAWESGAKVFQLSTAGAGGTSGNFGSIWARFNSLRFVNAAYYNGSNYVYADTGTAPSMFGQFSDGSYSWLRAASGTAGGTFSFTTQMALDASGNLGVGTSSPGGSNRIDARGAAGTGNGEIAISLTDTTSANPIKLVRTGGTYSYAGISAYEAAIYTYGSNMTLCVDGAYAMKLATNGSERARISSDGGFSVGTTTSPGAGLISDQYGNVRSLPLNSQTSAYVVAASDNGKVISITTGGVTINNSIMSAGMVVTIYNNSGSSQTITQGTGVTLQWAGQSSSTTGNRTLGLYGMATVYFLSASSAVITGSGLT